MKLKKFFISIFFSILVFLIIFKVSNQNIIHTIIFSVFSFILNYNSFAIYSSKKDKFFYILFSFIFSFFQVIGYNCFNYEVSNIGNIKTWVLILILTISLYNVIKVIFNFNVRKLKDFKLSINFFNNKHLFLIVFLLIFISWLPVIIKFYPGNYSYDVEYQLMMYTNKVTFSQFHPVIHTLILGIFIINFDNLFFYSLFQSVLMALIFSKTIVYLNKKNFSKTLNLIFLLIYMFLPTHVIMAITTTKDVLFSGIFMLAIMKFIDIVESYGLSLKSKKNLIFIIIILFLLLIFRNNMYYALVVSIPFMILIFRNSLKKIFIIFLASLTLFFSYNLILTNVFNVEPQLESESLSIVMQSFARVYKYEHLNNEEKERIENLFLPKTLEKYNSRISDPIKINFNNSILKQDLIGYVKLYLKYMFKYPITILDSWFNMFYSYFYNYDVLPQGWQKKYIEVNCINNFEKSQNCSENRVYVTYKNLLDKAKYQEIPILRILMNSSTYIYILIILIFNIIRKKKYELLFPIIPLFMYFLTDLLAPVALMRYVYPILVSFSLIIYLFGKSNDSN